MAVILITGASGSIGRQLIQILEAGGHVVRTLTTRSINKSLQQNAFLWNLKTQYIEQNAFQDVEIIIHLSGANVAARRWSESYRREILESRAGAAALLHQKALESGAKIKKFISMSGVGYYPDPSEVAFDESGPNGTGFMAAVCKEWEDAARKFENTGASVVWLRTAPVLSRHAGILPAYLMTHFMRVIPTLGSPHNRLSWIHISDLCRFIANAASDESITGIYNLVSPHAVSQKDFVQTIDKVSAKKSLHPNVPAFLLHLALGERAALPLTNQVVLPARMLESGFHFEFPDMESALKDLI